MTARAVLTCSRPTGDNWSALFAGSAFAFSFYRLNHLPHITLDSTEFMPLVLLAAYKLLWMRSRRWALALTVFFTLQALSGHYLDRSKKLPDELLAKMLAAKNVDSGLINLRQLSLGAVDQASREIHQRFDFKNTDTSLTLADNKIEMHSATEDRLKAAYQVLQEKAVKREVPLKALQPQDVEPAAKGSVRQTISLVTGISDEKAKEISKRVRQAVPKIQTQIQGSQVRVMSKSKDDLQAAIRAVKEHDFGIALQFTNYR